MNLPVPTGQSELDTFINFLYDGSEGYVYLAAKIPNDAKDWKQEFFHFPTEVNNLKSAIRNATTTHEVYIAPALFKEQEGPRDEWSAQKPQFKESNVVWIDFDGNAPADYSDFPSNPSFILQSSIEGRQHVYWRLTSPITNIQEIENVTRSLAYNFAADTGTWDATRVLRPPETFNHKRSGEVKVLSFVDAVFDIDLFNSLPPIPEAIKSEWQVSELPNAQDVILEYAFPPDLVNLLKKDKHEVQDRSRSLQHLAYGCAELGMSDNEIFVVLRMADDIWEKFKFRRDRDRRIADIILVARNKHPAPEDPLGEEGVQVWDYQSFINADIEIDWVVEGMLMEGGNGLLTGPSGIGKTQFTLELVKHVALGKDFLHYKIEKARRVAMLSLEMGHADLNIFMRKQDELLNPEERLLLKQNFHVIPHGESWALNLPVGQERLARLIDQFKWEGLFVDSIGSAVIGNISSNETVQSFTNFNDRIRKHFGMFLFYLHHNRKSQPGGNQRIDQDDVYGDQYLVNRSTSTYSLLRGKAGSIRVRNFKNRLAPLEPDYFIERNANLGFSRIEVPTPTIPTGATSGIDKQGEDVPPAGAGGFKL